MNHNLGILATLTWLSLSGGDLKAQQPQSSSTASEQTETKEIERKTFLLRVLQKGTGIPVKRVEIRNGQNKAYTDNKGEFEINLPNNDGFFELYKQSFELTRIPFKTVFEEQKENTYIIYLYPETPPDNEVLIRGVRRPEVSRKAVSVEEAVKVAPGADPAQIPKILPGVQTTSFSERVIVRGSGPDDSIYYIEDWSVPFIFHRIGNISIIPSQILEDVEFSSGGFGPQYGNATGGAIILRTKTQVPERPKTDIRINIPFYSSIYHESPIGNEQNAYYAVSARRSYIDKILPKVLPKDMGLTLVPFFHDAHLYYFRTTESGHIKFLALTSADGLKLAVPSDIADDQDGTAEFFLSDSVHSFGIEWLKKLDNEWTLTTSPQLTRQEVKFSVLDNRFELRSTALSIRSEGKKRLSKKERMYVGGEATYGKAYVDVLAPQQVKDDPFFDFEEAPKIKRTINANFYELGSWVSRDREFGDFILTPGLRAFYASWIDRSGWDPRLNARYQINADNMLKAAIGRYSQSPRNADVDEEFGNPNLDFIKSYHYVLGIETKWSDRWNTDFQLFYKDTRNLIRSDKETNLNNNGSAYNYGFEAFIRRNLTQRFFGWLAYTYSINRERDNDEETYRNSQYDQTHILNLASSYKLSAAWELGGRFVYRSGDTYTKVDDAVYNTNLDKYQPRQDPDSRPYNARLPNYHELNLYVTQDILYDTWKMVLRYGCEYLATEPQAQSVQYNYDYSKQENFQGLPPIPYFELRAEL